MAVSSIKFLLPLPPPLTLPLRCRDAYPALAPDETWPETVDDAGAAAASAAATRSWMRLLRFIAAPPQLILR